MAFKLKATLIEFMGDEKRFPCHFLYKVGDSFIYDGEKFQGRVCPGCLGPMAPVLVGMRAAGNKLSEGIPFRYAGLSARDESMAKYDGLGFRPLKQIPEGCQPQHLTGLPPEPPKTRRGGWTFTCGDARTAAFFFVEPIDISSRGYDVPYYRRSMSMLEKLKAQPGMTPEEIIAKYTDFERDEIYPPLTPLLVECLLDEMAQVDYVEKRDGKYFPLARAADPNAVRASAMKP